MFNYQQLINENNIKSLAELNTLFWEDIAYDWGEAYKSMSEKHGVITLQNFHGYAFIIDDGNQLPNRNSPEKEILESRVVAAFGLTHTNVNKNNRKMMRKWIGKTSEIFKFFGDKYDKGHFIAHGFGGPIDVNLFPQRRDINRGWGPVGKPYRDMERFIAKNPGVFVFSRPIYTDLSFCPSILEYGYCDFDLNFFVQQFPNR